MPGSPDPVLGSVALTSGVSFVVATILVALPLLLRNRLPSARRLAFGGGLMYALISLGTWAGARIVTDAFVSSMVENPAILAGFLVLGTVVLGTQAAIPFYLHARWGLVTPLVGLFGATHLVLFAFLQVRGETDPLGLYSLFIGPLVIGIIVVAALAEIGIRRTVEAIRQ